MARASESKESKVNKSVVAKIAEKAAKKAVKKTAEKVARATSTKVAAKVASETAINPDYDPTEDFDVQDDAGEPDAVSLFGGFSKRSEVDDSDEDDFDFSGDYEEEEEEADDFDTEEDDDLTHAYKSADIFAHANNVIKKGTPIRFQIKKNGQFLSTIRKPYSEEQLQKDYGEGHYTVILRDDVKGTFIKQQSFSIAAPVSTSQSIEQINQEKEALKAQEDQKIDKMFTTFSSMQQQQTEAQQLMIERIMEEQRRREEEERERRREERELMKEQEKNNMGVLATVLQASLSKREDGGGMAAILQMMQAQQQQTSMLIMESNKNFLTMMQEMRRDTDKMLDKLTTMSQEQARDFRQQISEMANKKSGADFDALKMFEMLNETRESGLNFGLKIHALAKEVADSEAAPSQPKGLVESVMDNLGKIAPLMIAAGQNNHAQAAAQAPVQQHQGGSHLVPVPAAPSYRAAKAPAATRTVPATATVQAAKPVKTAAPTAPKSGVKKTATQTRVANSAESGKINNDAELKKRVIDTCVPLIGGALQKGVNSGGLGDMTVSAFESQGINIKDAVRLVSSQDILDLAFKTYGLPEMPELKVYLKDYHDYLVQKASSAQSGQAT